MVVDERRRVELFERLVAAVGEEAASTMLELLPPPGRDVATSDDISRLEAGIDALEQRLAAFEESMGERFAAFEVRMDERFAAFERQTDERFEVLEGRFTQMEDRLSAAFERRINDAITAQTRTIIFGLLGALVIVGGYALSLARLAG